MGTDVETTVLLQCQCDPEELHRIAQDITRLIEIDPPVRGRATLREVSVRNAINPRGGIDPRGKVNGYGYLRMVGSANRGGEVSYDVSYFGLSPRSEFIYSETPLKEIRYSRDEIRNATVQ